MKCYVTGRPRVTGYAVLLTLAFLVISAMFAPRVDAAMQYRAVITYEVQPGDSLWRISQQFKVSTSQLIGDNPGIDAQLVPGQVLYITTSVLNNAFPYRVLAGDTLYRISERLGRSIASISEASGLRDSRIYAGQTLRVPAADHGQFPVWVQPGDTLHRICTRYGVSVSAIRSLNPLRGDQIRVHQILRLPGSHQHAENVEADSSPPPTTSPGTSVIQHRVRPGETISLIAHQYNTTRWAIWGTNHLQSDLIMVDQLLYIPVNESQPVHVTGPSGSTVPGYGELLEWQWARWYYPPGTEATIMDLWTGLRFNVRRLGGSNHADSEPLTVHDTEVMRQIFGGWTWTPRPILIEVRGKTLAAAAASMPHDVQTIYDNNFPGHFCLYFYGSRTHRTNSINPEFQRNVLIAAGRQQ